MKGLIFFILIFWVLPAIIKGIKKKGNPKQSQGAQAARPSAPRQTPSVELHRPAPSMKRQATTAVRSANRNYSAPDAPCIVCENTGEDHFQRDKARRIAQLDDWLKNGLIDRSEYLVLKDRYQRGI